MKTVYTNSQEVMHLFAQQIQTDIKNSSRNVFTGRSNYELNYADIIYSYGHHYELGRFIDENTILINDEGYSVTTSKHISELSYATSQYRQFFKTKTDLDLVLSQCKENYNKWIKARKPEIYINNINNLFRSINKYIDYRKLKIKRDKRYLEIKKIYKTVNSGNVTSLENYRKRVKANEAKKLKKQTEKAIKEFYNFERNSIRLGNKEDYLRISKNGENVETSQGVTVAINQALTLYEMILANKDIKGYKIGYYTVNSINGTLKIGCHNINIESMHRVGKKLLNN